MTLLLRVHVAGPPIPQPRPRHSPRGIVYAAPKSDPIWAYRDSIRLAAQVYCRGRDPCLEAVRLAVEFIFSRPVAKIYKRKPMPSYHHTARPDLDNLLKGVKDALSGVVWRDDAQVAEVRMSKRVAAGDEQPGTFIDVEHLPQLEIPERGRRAV